MQDIKFNKTMISTIQDFKEFLKDREQYKQIAEMDRRYILINMVAKLYTTKINTIIFYKNPYLFTMKEEYDDKNIVATIEGNKCLFQILDKSDKIIERCLINFTTKRYLMM